MKNVSKIKINKNNNLDLQSGALPPQDSAEGGMCVDEPGWLRMCSGNLAE